MSDQETAIQLIRNEAAELIARAKAAGLSLLVYNASEGTIVDIKPFPLPQNNFHFVTSHRDALKPELGDRRFWAIPAKVQK